MAANKNAILWAGYIAIIALGLTYVFWGADLIPDSLSSALPGTFIGYMDDAIALILMFLGLAKWRQIITGTKNKAGLGWKGFLIFTPILALILVYVFWVADIIPDTIPFVGYADDVIAILLGVFVAAKVWKKLKGKE